MSWMLLRLWWRKIGNRHKTVRKSTPGNLNSCQGFFKVKDLSWTKLKFKDFQAFPAIRHNAVFLKDDITLPVFGGSIIFNNIVYNDIFSPGRNLHLSINIEGINLAEASDTFNIPRFEGNLSGSISRASFKENRFRTDGEILLDVFDGKIKMKDLSIDNVFSPIASLRISLEIDEINLGKLTGTFDFGHVSGILRGYIQGLVIVNGQAESFKMAIEKRDKTKDQCRGAQKDIHSWNRILCFHSGHRYLSVF